MSLFPSALPIGSLQESKGDGMLAIIGLGNPGAAYENSRHNAGWKVLDILGKQYGITINKNRCKAQIGEGMAGGHRIALVKPQTYMNLSGDSVAAVMHWYKIQPEQTLILSDDIDLSAGAVRIRPHGGAGTHNGWRSIIAVTGSDRFPRIRIGVGAPPPGWDLKDWVLSDFGADQEIMNEAFERAAQAADCFIKNGIDLSMNRFNKR